MKGLLAALSCLIIAGCATTRTGGETAVLRARISDAQGSVGKSLAEAKQIVALVHGAGDLRKRIDFKTTRPLKLLDR